MSTKVLKLKLDLANHQSKYVCTTERKAGHTFILDINLTLVGLLASYAVGFSKVKYKNSSF